MNRYKFWAAKLLAILVFLVWANWIMVQFGLQALDLSHDEKVAHIQAIMLMGFASICICISIACLSPNNFMTILRNVIVIFLMTYAATRSIDLGYQGEFDAEQQLITARNQTIAGCVGAIGGYGIALFLPRRRKHAFTAPKEVSQLA